jgi:transposase
MSRNLFWLSDEQWARIEPHLPTDVRGVERANDRRVISGIGACAQERLPLVRLPGSLWSADDDL